MPIKLNPVQSDKDNGARVIKKLIFIFVVTPVILLALAVGALLFTSLPLKIFEAYLKPETMQVVGLSGSFNSGVSAEGIKWVTDDGVISLQNIQVSINSIWERYSDRRFVIKEFKVGKGSFKFRGFGKKFTPKHQPPAETQIQTSEGGATAKNTKAASFEIENLSIEDLTFETPDPTQNAKIEKFQIKGLLINDRNFRMESLLVKSDKFDLEIEGMKFGAAKGSRDAIYRKLNLIAKKGMHPALVQDLDITSTVSCPETATQIDQCSQVDVSALKGKVTAAFKVSNPPTFQIAVSDLTVKEYVQVDIPVEHLSLAIPSTTLENFSSNGAGMDFKFQIGPHTFVKAVSPTQQPQPDTMGQGRAPANVAANWTAHFVAAAPADPAVVPPTLSTCPPVKATSKAKNKCKVDQKANAALMAKYNAIPRGPFMISLFPPDPKANPNVLPTQWLTISSANSKQATQILSQLRYSRLFEELSPEEKQQIMRDSMFIKGL